ncbi:hypothetical protein [Pseudophaeobacter sp.]|uniref:hypothetical protein n=1 Tax=Pseudophaeobacter sp. TaxID=1971739 RepID=UPI003299A6E8
MDKNWKSATKADRAALYHVARSVADTTNLSVEAIMEQAFGHKLMVGTDYLSNFRSGAIGRPKAKLIHAWIAEHHLETAHAIAPVLFPKLHTNAWDGYVDAHGIKGQLQIKRFVKGELNLIRKVKDRSHPDVKLNLGEEFCFFLRVEFNAHAVGFERFKGEWHAMPLGKDGTAMFKLTSDEPHFPVDGHGKFERLVEDSDLGLHRFVFIIAECINDLPTKPDLTAIGKGVRLHYIDVRFLT